MLKRFVKITLVLAIVFSMLTPYTTVFAELKHTDTTANLQSSTMHGGGEESSGTLTKEQEEFYDTTPYMYEIGDMPTIIKIAKEGEGFSNMLYCLNGKKSFPAITNSGATSLEYKNVGDFFDSTNQEVKSLHLSTSNSADSAKWTANYKALSWLFENFYLPTQAPEQKDEFLGKVFKDYKEFDLDTVKAFLTDDDIDVVQQCAMWYFTNGDSSEFAGEELPAVNLTKVDLSTQEQKTGSYKDLTGYDYRQKMANYLYKYLITNAKAGTASSTVKKPTIADTKPTMTENDNYYIVGPYKVNSGTVEGTVKLLDQNGTEIPRASYKILIENKQDFEAEDVTVNKILDTNYYIYLPKTNTTITTINLELSSTTYGTQASVWKNKTTNASGEEIYQPVVLLTRGKDPSKNNLPVNIIRKTESPDLALRKYIVKVNNKTVDQAPKVDVSKLKDGTSTTAEYKHAKEPISVSKGDTIVYEIRVYNEGDVDATGVSIVDYLPEGLELVKDSSINETYKWTVAEKPSEDITSTYVTTDYLKNEKINKFDKEKDETLDSKYVQIECKIADTAKASAVLTNIAEIKADGIEDRDSVPGNNDYINKGTDSSNYTGDKNNKTDLTDKDYYYKGVEDDDDFAKVKVEGKSFDLSLQKFITKINEKAPSKSREPKVDVSKLKDGTSTDATYTTVKTPLTVEQGDVIIYTLRVYNEGELDGYAEQVSDYLPEGLGYLVNHTVNVDNYWSIPSDSKTVKLSTIPNATKKLSADDFTGVKSLSEVEVVTGKVKLTSTKLSSKTETEGLLNTKNLLKAFDKEKGTKLDYKDIQVACVVLADKVSGNNFKNIAEIMKETDENGKEITDRDSTPDTVNPDNYPGDDKNQDDNDYENLTIQEPGKEPEEFDLSLQKFITGLNDKKVEGREPKVSINTQGKIQFTSSVSPLQVENNNIITYTIRVYNEGNVPGYAKEVSDDLPEGLEFVKDNEINKKYGWKLYDKNGKETSDIKQAVSVKTDYLSKSVSTERKDDCLIKAFDGKTVYYKDVQIAFKVVESKVNKTTRIIKNIAEITDDEDQNGNPIDDIDSTPGNNKTGEDDIDDEQVYVKYFDLSLQKDLVKIIITEDGKTREIAVSSTDGLQKVEIHRKKINSTTVKFVYNITVKNEGEIAGYATEIKDYIPEGLEFIAEDNSNWTKVSDNVVTTSALSEKRLEPGQSATVQIVLKWINGENNLNLKVNTAEISKDKNDSNTPDIDSTPDNKVPGEDDIDTAEVYLAISTGTAPTYIALTTVVLAIMTTGVILIKKYVL